MRVAGQWHCVYRAIDQFGQVIDVFVSARRDATAARRFLERAIGATKLTPVEVVTDQAPVYPALLEEFLPAAWHRTEQYANNRVEADHGRLKARLRPMRGLKQDRSARVIIAGHAFIQNFGGATTNWRSRSPPIGGWWSRSTNWSWRSDPSGRGDFSLPWAGATQQCPNSPNALGVGGLRCGWSPAGGRRGPSALVAGRPGGGGGGTGGSRR